MGPFTIGIVRISGEVGGSVLLVDVRGKVDEEYDAGLKEESRGSERLIHKTGFIRCELSLPI